MLPLICRISSLKTNFHHLHKFPIFAHISLVSFSTSTPQISIFDYLVNHHNFSPECASKVSSSLSTNYINKPQNVDCILNFLKETGFTTNQIEVVVQKEPGLLSAKLETSVKPKIKVLQDFGFQSTDLADIVSASPFLLRISADRLRLSILGLKNVLGPNADICTWLKKSGVGRLLKRDLDRTLIPNVEYLKSCGICSLQIANYIRRCPFMFLFDQEKLKGFVQRVDEMGFERESKMYVCAVRVISSMSTENWELKLKLIEDLGFSKQNISYAFRVTPQAFGTSEKKIKEVMQLLLSVDDFSIYDIVCNPILLCYSVEKRLKPRLRLLKALQSKNLLKKKPTIGRFFQISDADFRNKYMVPYSDKLGDLCEGSQDS